MRVVIAPDAFKESLSAALAAEAIHRGMQSVAPDWKYQCVPMADGGEGTLRTVLDARNGELQTLTVRGPLGAAVRASYGVAGKTAVIEMAEASGLMHVLPEQRSVMDASTYGTGELIRAALGAGMRRFVICLGGSATCDAGMGAMEALGARFLDAQGQELTGSGKNLVLVRRIDRSHMLPELKEAEFFLACDVSNPLYGELGAAHVFAPQKGASTEQVDLLEKGMRNFASQLEKETGVAVAEVPGAGAAGGLAAGLAAFLNAEFCSGVELVASEVHLSEYLERADLVITGEGEINGQTSRGKTPVGVARLAKRHGLPVIAFMGSLGPGYESVYAEGIDALYPIVASPCSLSYAMDHAETLIEAAAARLTRLLNLTGVVQES